MLHRGCVAPANGPGVIQYMGDTGISEIFPSSTDDGCVSNGAACGSQDEMDTQRGGWCQGQGNDE